jgi:WD40 repeat protein
MKISFKSFLCCFSSAAHEPPSPPVAEAVTDLKERDFLTPKSSTPQGAPSAAPAAGLPLTPPPSFLSSTAITPPALSLLAPLPSALVPRPPPPAAQAPAIDNEPVPTVAEAATEDSKESDFLTPKSSAPQGAPSAAPAAGLPLMPPPSLPSSSAITPPGLSLPSPLPSALVSRTQPPAAQAPASLSPKIDAKSVTYFLRIGLDGCLAVASFLTPSETIKLGLSSQNFRRDLLGIEADELWTQHYIHTFHHKPDMKLPIKAKADDAKFQPSSAMQAFRRMADNPFREGSELQLRIIKKEDFWQDIDSKSENWKNAILFLHRHKMGFGGVRNHDPAVGHTCVISSIAALPNGGYLTGSWDRTAIVWDKNKTPFMWLGAPNNDSKILGHTRPVMSVASLPDGGYLTCEQIGVAIVWDAKGNIAHRLVVPNDNPTIEQTDGITSAIALPNGGYLTGCLNHIAIVWDAKGKFVRRFGVPNNSPNPIRRNTHTVVAALPNGGYLTGSGDFTAIAWDREGNFLCRLGVPFNKNPAVGHTNSVFSVAALPNGGYLTGSVDHTTILWDAEGRLVRRLGKPGNEDPAVGCTTGIQFVAESWPQILTVDCFQAVVWSAKPTKHS